MRRSDTVNNTLKKALAFALSVAIAVTFIPATSAFAAKDSGSDMDAAARRASQKMISRAGRSADQRFRIRIGAAGDDDEISEELYEYTLDEYKAMLKEYVDQTITESAPYGESAYCSDVWSEIIAVMDETKAFIDAAKEEDDLFTTDGFFLYPVEKIEANLALIEALCEIDLHYVKDKESGIRFIRKEMKESIDSCRAAFETVQYNDFYKARLVDLIADLKAELNKAVSFRQCVMLNSRIEEELVMNLPMMDDILILFDSEEEEGAAGFKYLYTSDEVDAQRAAVANRINCYVDIQLKESGYKGDMKKLKSEAKALIKSLKAKEIVEEIWETGDSWIAAKEKQTGIAYEPLDEGDRLRALKALSELSYKYARSDYSEPSWDEVEQVFMDAQTIIYSAEKKAEIRNVISDAKKKLAKVLTIKAETAKVKAEALKDLKQYTNRKKYKAAGVKIAKAAMKKIRKSADLDEINDLWASAEQKCGKYIKRFRIQVVKKGPGKVSGSKSVKYGGKYTVKLQPKAGKRIKKVYIDGKKKKLRNSYTFKNVKKKHTIKVLFGN